MSDSDAIDLESVADTQQDSGDRSVSTGKKVSSLYSLWRCEPAEFRDATHRGAHCLLCKAHQEERGQPVDPKGHCLADQPSILAHIKNCPHQQKSDRARAEVELAAYRARKRKRPDSSSDPSSKSAPLSKYMAHQDKPFTAEGQKAFEQQCLKATVSANLPMSAWDDPEFRKTYTDVRPKLTLPSRKTMSGRILKDGAKAASDKMKATVKASGGEPLVNSVAC